MQAPCAWVQVKAKLTACKTLAIATFSTFLPVRRRAYPNSVTTLTLYNQNLGENNSWSRETRRPLVRKLKHSPSESLSSVPASGMKQALVNLLLYAPVAFAVAETYLAFKLYDPAMPFIRLTELEEGLERRGLLSDAAVGLLAHLVVWLSSESPVRAAAKAFYAVFLVNLWYAGPRALLAINGAEQIVRIDQVERNQYVVLFFACLNAAGAFLLRNDCWATRDPVLDQLRAPGEPGAKED